MSSEDYRSNIQNSDVTTKDMENLLKKIGMTEYQAKIYATLVKNGVCDAKKLSELSDVPVTRVYESLKEMKENGLVAVQKNRPKRYKVVSLDSLTNLIENEKERLERKIEEKKDIFEKIKKVSPEPNKNTIEKNNEGMWFIEEVENTMKNFKKDIKSSKEEILIFSGDLSWVPNLYEDLKEAQERGVQTRLLCEDGQKVENRLNRLENIGVRSKNWEGQKLRGAIFDSEKISLVLEKPRKLKMKDQKENGRFKYEKITSRNPVLVETMKNYFEFWWTEKAQKINLSN